MAHWRYWAREGAPGCLVSLHFAAPTCSQVTGLLVTLLAACSWPWAVLLAGSRPGPKGCGSRASADQTQTAALPLTCRVSMDTSGSLGFPRAAFLSQLYHRGH